MIKKIFKLYFLLLIFTSCGGDEKYVIEYFPNGNIKFKTQVDSKGVPNGTYEEYYETSELYLKGKLVNAWLSDTLFKYFKNGKLEEIGKLEKGLKKGWWSYYDSTGKLIKQNEYLIIRDSIYQNQSILYRDDLSIDYDRSSFFEIELNDTINLGRNTGKIKYYSNFDYYRNFLNVVIENKYSESEKVKDTFPFDPDFPFFGVFGSKTGHKTIKGEILETVFLKSKIDVDSFEVRVQTHKKYFEKEVYVQDTLRVL